MCKHIAVIIVFSMLVIISGCAGGSLQQDIDISPTTEPDANTNIEFTFIGESESWIAKLKVDFDFMSFEEDGTLQYNGNDHSVLYVTYKGDISDLESMKNLRIVCGESSMEETFDNRRSSAVQTFMLPVSVKEINKADTIEATVTIDNDSQAIELNVCDNQDVFTNGNNDFIENHFVFKGESEYWTGEMTVDSSSVFYESKGTLGCDATEKERLTVTYKGDVADLTSVKKVIIAYDSGSSGGSLEESHDNEYPLREKTFTLSGGCSGCSFFHEDDIITVTVTIDDETESFEMRNEA